MGQGVNLYDANHSMPGAYGNPDKRSSPGFRSIDFQRPRQTILISFDEHCEEESRVKKTSLAPGANPKSPHVCTHYRDSNSPRAPRLLSRQSQREMGFHHGLGHAEISI